MYFIRRHRSDQASYSYQQLHQLQRSVSLWTDLKWDLKPVSVMRLRRCCVTKACRLATSSQQLYLCITHYMQTRTATRRLHPAHARRRHLSGTATDTSPRTMTDLTVSLSVNVWWCRRLLYVRLHVRLPGSQACTLTGQGVKHCRRQ